MNISAGTTTHMSSAFSTASARSYVMCLSIPVIRTLSPSSRTEISLFHFAGFEVYIVTSWPLWAISAAIKVPMLPPPITVILIIIHCQQYGKTYQHSKMSAVNVHKHPIFPNHTQNFSLGAFRSISGQLSLQSS